MQLLSLIPLASLLLLAGAPRARPVAPSPDGNAILAYVDSKIFSESMSYRIRMNTFRGGSAARSYQMMVHKGGDRLRIEFEEPAVERGRRVLNDGENLWMYLSRTSRTIRLANRQAFMGSDASNQDLLRVSLRRSYVMESATEETVEGERLVLVSLRARDPAVAYDRVKLYVTPGSFIPRVQEFVTRSGRVVKRMEYSRPATVGDAPFPMHIEIVNPLLPGARTTLDFSAVTRSASHPASMFTVQALRR